MSTITILNPNDTGSTSRGVINTNFTNLNTDKAELASPVFTGAPSLPTGTTGITQTAGDNSTKIATTGYVDTVLADISCRVYQSAITTLTASGTFYAMNFGAENFDTNSMHSVVTDTSRITINTTGKYIVGGTVYATASVTMGLNIRINGATTIAGSFSDFQASTGQVSVSTLYSFTAGDYVEFLASSNNAGQATSGDSRCNAWAIKI